MAWIESHQALQRHRKTIRAANLLKITRPLLIGHLHCLWWWAIDNADSDGRLGQVSDAELAEAAEWPVRQAGNFLEALRDSGFIEVDDEGSVRLHDWYDYAGKLIDRRNANAERMRDARSGRVSLKAVARDPTRVEHVRSTFDARAQTRAHTCGATQPNPTQPDTTGTGETPKPPSGEPPDVVSSTASPTLVSQSKTRVKAASKPAKTGPSLAPLFDAFAALGLPKPVMMNREPVAAQGLLGHYAAEQLAECWRDYSVAAYGNDFDQRNLSFGYLSTNNRVGNWVAWKANGSSGHAENRRHSGANGEGPRGAHARAGASRADEVDPFAQYVIRD